MFGHEDESISLLNTHILELINFLKDYLSLEPLELNF